MAPSSCYFPSIANVATNLSKPAAATTLHSVVLVGLQNIATLNMGRSSPFNIARQARLAGFTLDEVRDLFAQYSAESGQGFAPGVIEEIVYQTAGHPFLVNRLGALLSEEIATDRNQPINESDLQRAISRLVRERNYNFESLIRNANPPGRGAQHPLLVRNEPLIRTTHWYTISICTV